MYIRTKTGFGQDQETWSAPQALTRLKVQSVPIGYLGGLNDCVGQPKGEYCIFLFYVYFDPDKDWPSTVKIEKIADNIVSIMKLKKKGSEGDLRLKLHVTGYFDTATDSWRSDKWLDDRRAANVLRHLLQALDSENKGGQAYCR